MHHIAATCCSEEMNIEQASLRFSVYIANLTFSFKQRYGWHGLDDPDLQENITNAAKKYPWIDNYRDKSVTEIEFLHGHLNSPGQIPAVLAFRDRVNYTMFSSCEMYCILKWLIPQRCIFVLPIWCQLQNMSFP